MNTQQNQECTKLLQSLEKIIFDLNDDNCLSTVHSIISLFNFSFPYSFNLILCKLIYLHFVILKYDYKFYFQLIQSIEAEEENINKDNVRVFNVFMQFLLGLETQESYYLLEKMVEENIINPIILKKKETLYFAHYKTAKELESFEDSATNFVMVDVIYSCPFGKQFFLRDHKMLSKNNWKLQKRLVKEGVNPNEIAKIIRNDEIDKLQEMSSQPNFDFNQRIEPSLYERCSFINHEQENVTLIDYAAFFGSIKCFKYLLMNNAKVNNTGKYAVAGGNEEIIHLCEQNHSTFECALETAIEFH